MRTLIVHRRQIFAHLIFATKATGENFLLVKIFWSTVNCLLNQYLRVNTYATNLTMALFCLCPTKIALWPIKFDYDLRYDQSYDKSYFQVWSTSKYDITLQTNAFIASDEMVSATHHHFFHIYIHVYIYMYIHMYMYIHVYTPWNNNNPRTQGCMTEK